MLYFPCTLGFVWFQDLRHLVRGRDTESDQPSDKGFLRVDKASRFDGKHDSAWGERSLVLKVLGERARRQEDAVPLENKCKADDITILD